MCREQEDAIHYHVNTFRCVTVTVMQNVQELTVTISSKVFQKISQNMDDEPASAEKTLRRKKRIFGCEGNGSVVTNAE